MARRVRKIALGIGEATLDGAHSFVVSRWKVGARVTRVVVRFVANLSAVLAACQAHRSRSRDRFAVAGSLSNLSRRMWMSQATLPALKRTRAWRRGMSALGRLAMCLTLVGGPRAARAQDRGAAQEPTSKPVAGEPVGPPDNLAPGPDLPPPPAPASTGPRSGQPFHFDELTLDLGFDANWRRRQTNSSDVRPGYRYRQTDEYRRFEETVGVRAAGDIIDEKVMRYQFNFRTGLSQESNNESRPGVDTRNSPYGDITQYDARVTLFPAGKITANAFASNLDSRVTRPFLPSLNRQTERYGTELSFNDRILPMRLSYEHEYEELSSFSRPHTDDERRGDDRLRYEATYQQSDAHQLRLEYEYDDRHERYSGTRQEFDTSRNYLNLTDTLLFGADRKSRLDTVVRHQDEAGELGRDVTEFAPQLRLQHTESLSTTYRGQYLAESYDQIDTKTYRGDFGVNHRLGDWLDSGLNLYGLTEQADQGSDLQEFGGGATASVQKENSLGRFTGNISYTHAWQRVSDPGDDGVVLSEAVTFRDPLQVVLNHTGIRRFSILVTDVTRTRVYLPGRDYTVAQVGRYTGLQRVRNGQIVDGQTVLVSYVYRVGEGRESNRDRVDMRVQQAFKNGWTPYYALSMQDERVDRTRFLVYEPRDVNRHRLGVDYRQPKWTVGSELEYNDDSVDPYKAVHVRGDATLYERAPHSLTTRGNYSFYHFEGADELDAHDTSLFDVGLNYRFTLTNNVSASAAAAYRFEDDTINGITHGVDLSASLEWKIGFFSALFEVEYDQLKLPGSDDGSFAAWIKLRRDIPVITRREP